VHECLVNSISFRVEGAEVIRRVESIGRSSVEEATVRKLVEHAQKIARPMAFYRIGCIEGRGPGWVEIHGVRLESRRLAEYTSEVNRVFLYIATCGSRLEDWSRMLSGDEEVAIAEVIKEMALEQVRKAMYRHMSETWHVDISDAEEIHPGDKHGWSVTHMPVLFHLLGDTQARVGVSLTSRFELLPKRSAVGVIIPSGCNAITCNYCPNEECQNRKAPCREEELRKTYNLAGV
jgi:hypothetical protein